MRIGIMTFHWATNYGAVLQAYALSKALENKGHEVTIIDYYPEKYKKKWTKVFFTYHPERIPASIKQLKKEKEIKTFRDEYLKKTKYFSSAKELKQYVFDYDCYICGSDQIWNPSFVRYGDQGITLSYFLDFIPNGAKKISYAASFGVKEYPEDLKNKIKDQLVLFNAISVREETGLGILKDINICDAQLVPDPTILLDASIYKKLLKEPKRSEKYDFVYMLHSRKADAIPLLKKRKREGVMSVHCGNIGIEDWLTEIYGADLVITNSFHGIVFSIIFEKNFAPILIKGSGMNDRIITLLNKLGLSDRICEDLSEFKNEPIDWKTVKKKLKEFSDVGYSYLNSVLSKEAEEEI
ncbi:MAG: polysaccharide pyruvyl transferase family protein [Clostridia bacterium]|nr:polysaccharide pyruvyl transferase family protein [Clostridia bacterium]